MDKGGVIMKRKKKKMGGVAALKARYGRICVAHWVIGLILFFLIPIIKSIYFAFADVSISVGGMKSSFVGLKNFIYIFTKDPDYLDNIAQSVVSFLYSFPIIIILSLILALILNQKFKGRTFFRALYFLPVIIASGAVLTVILSATTDSVSEIKNDESVALAMIDINQLVEWSGLPTQIGEYLTNIINGIMTLIWNCGIQIVLFISGMQSIPELLYEVSKVEGATKWEEFWLITLPMLSRTVILVAVFTMVEVLTSQDDKVMTQAYSLMKSQFYGESSAMLWAYFLVIGTLMAIFLTVYNRAYARKWE